MPQPLHFLLLLRDNPPDDTAAAPIASARANRAKAPVHDGFPDPADHAQQVAGSAHPRTARDEKQVLDQDSGQANRTQDLTYEDPRDVARRLLSQYGLDPNQFNCLNQRRASQDDQDFNAQSSSTAYRTPQARSGGRQTDLPTDHATEWFLPQRRRTELQQMRDAGQPPFTEDLTKQPTALLPYPHVRPNQGGVVMSPRKVPPQPQRVEAIRQTWRAMRGTETGDKVRLHNTVNPRVDARWPTSGTVVEARGLTFRVVWDDGSHGQLVYGRDVWEVVP